jgi:hypothetical protein
MLVMEQHIYPAGPSSMRTGCRQAVAVLGQPFIPAMTRIDVGNV